MRNYNPRNLTTKRDFVLDELIKVGVTHTQDGKDINEADYETLKVELVLQAFKEIDVEVGANKWF